MRIGIGGYFLRHPTTGSGQYLTHLVAALAELGGDDQITLLSPMLPSPSWEREQEDRARTKGAIETNRSPRVSGYRTPFSGRHENLEKLWFEQITLPRAATAAGVELIHYPYFAAPWRSSLPVVVTVHDLIPMLLPAYRGGALVQAYTRLVSSTARRAAAIITDSDCSKRDVVRLLGIAEEKVTTVYLAASERYQPVLDASQLQAARARHHLGGPFVLYLGGIDQRKNVPTLIEAFAAVLRLGAGQPAFPENLTLALAGDIPSPGPLFPDVKAQVRHLGLDDRVRFLGRVSQEDAIALYSACELFVFPSLYEGFGLPPLEAMACGAPVVCANTSSLPEVVGDAAITVDPRDPAALTQALARVIMDQALRADLRQRGFRQAARFTWRRTAQQTFDVYRRVAACSAVP